MSGLGRALGTKQTPAVKTETEPKRVLHTGGAMIERSRVKTELSMSGDQRWEQRCPLDFEGVTFIPCCYAAEVGRDASQTQRK